MQVFAFKNGELHGKKLSYHKNGQLDEDICYNEGKQHGKYLKYHKNAHLAEDIDYEEDKKHGKALSYHKNGQLVQDCEYKQGELHGKKLTYDKSGKLKKETTYEEGKELWSELPSVALIRADHAKNKPKVPPFKEVTPKWVVILHYLRDYTNILFINEKRTESVLIK